MRNLPTALLLLGLAACSGGPLKELPVFEPPPEPAPEPAPPPPVPSSEPEEIFGAWTSTSLRGPGSAAFTRVLLTFDRDGRISAAAFGPERREARAGAFRLMDNAVEIDLADGKDRVWTYELTEGALELRDGETGLLLVRLR